MRHLIEFIHSKPFKKKWKRKYQSEDLQNKAQCSQLHTFSGIWECHRPLSTEGDLQWCGVRTLRFHTVDIPKDTIIYQHRVRTEFTVWKPGWNCSFHRWRCPSSPSSSTQSPGSRRCTRSRKCSSSSRGSQPRCGRLLGRSSGYRSGQTWLQQLQRPWLQKN